MPRDIVTERITARDMKTALLFDGVDGIGTIAGLTAFWSEFNNGGSYTVGCWIKTTATALRRMLGYSNGSSSDAFLFGINSNGSGSTVAGFCGLFIRDRDNVFKNIAPTANPSINDGKWHHILVTGTPSSNAVNAHIYYIDGVAVPTTLQNTNLVDNWRAPISDKLGVGCVYTNQVASGFLPATMDELFLGGYLTSSEEAKQIYLSGQFAHRNEIFYKFDELSGTVIKDSIGVNDGVLTGGVTYTTDVPIVGRESVNREVLFNTAIRDIRLPVDPTRSRPYKGLDLYRGINLTGLEFNRAQLPGILGTNYFQHTLALYQYISQKGFNTVRLPFCWERLQPTLNGNLDATYKALIDQNITWAQSVGIKIILDCHAYGRYSTDNGATLKIMGDGTLTVAHLADLWAKLSTVYKNEPTVLAYDIMNEPHNLTVDTDPNSYLTTSTNTLMMQGAIDAIRANNDSKTIIIASDEYSSIQNYLRGFTYGSDPSVWWTDPINNTWLQMHMYFDSDFSGNYVNNNLTLAGAGMEIYTTGNVLTSVADWAKRRNVQLYIGEYGIPRSDDGYLDALHDSMNIMDKYGMHGTYFAMGTNYHNSVIAINQLPGVIDRRQMDVVSKHL